jgi:hypothetical protein
VLSINIRSHIEFRLFIFDGVRVITCLVKSVFFIRHAGRKWTESCHKILFQSQSICHRNTSTGAQGLCECGSEPIKSFQVVFSISRRKGPGRRRRERWPSKIDSNWGKHCCCCWFVQKWPSNRIKNYSRIFEHPQDCSYLDSERGLGKEKVVCTFCSTLRDTWAKGRLSHILPRHYRDDQCRQIFLNRFIMGDEIWCFGYDRETKRQNSEWVGETSPRPKKLKFQRSASRPCW